MCVCVCVRARVRVRVLACAFIGRTDPWLSPGLPWASSGLRDSLVTTLLTYGLSAPPTRPAVPSSLPCSPHRCLSVTDSGLRSKAAPHSLSRAHPVCCSLSLQDSTSLVSSDLSCPSVICLCSPSSPWRKLPTHRPSVTSSEVLCRAWIQMLCISQLSCCGRIPQTPDLKQQVHFLTVLEAGSPRSRCCQG